MHPRRGVTHGQRAVVTIWDGGRADECAGDCGGTSCGHLPGVLKAPSLRYINIAAYKFARLGELKTLRARLLEWCKTAGLKGTILLSTEGVNLFVAGEAEAIEGLLQELRSIEGLQDLTPKYSESADQPFNRMVVRIKKEIIAFGVEGIDPAAYTSRKLPAKDLKQWLDDGRPVTLLDTRNDYEVKLGTFRGAVRAGIDHFRQFPEAVRALPPEMKETPIVMFCTGGIRCEKAGPFMEREGFKNIFQLEGGILKYFEECGAAHYDGECFVFDQRVGVDPALQETGSAQCYACQAPLTAEDQEDARYRPGVSCPHCYRTDDEALSDQLAKRQARIAALTTPLPGAEPYENRRPISIPGEADGTRLIEFLCTTFEHIPESEWRELIAQGLLRDEADRAVSCDAVVRAGQRYARVMPCTSEPAVSAEIVIRHEDEALVVIEKPAPLPMHPSGRFNRNTLQHFLELAYAPEKLRPAHRLDANTTGLVVLARAQKYARVLQPQFARREVEKVYLVRCAGWPSEQVFRCDLPISSEPGPLGSRESVEEGGKDAVTEFRVVARQADGTALLEARPLTGRTNQIRVHLWELGWPVCGDPAFLPGRQFGEAMTLPVGAPPLCLHAWRLCFTHPVTAERMKFDASQPDWAIQ